MLKRLSAIFVVLVLMVSCGGNSTNNVPTNNRNNGGGGTIPVPPPTDPGAPDLSNAAVVTLPRVGTPPTIDLTPLIELINSSSVGRNYFDRALYSDAIFQMDIKNMALGTNSIRVENAIFAFEDYGGLWGRIFSKPIVGTTTVGTNFSSLRTIFSTNEHSIKVTGNVTSQIVNGAVQRTYVATLYYRIRAINEIACPTTCTLNGVAMECEALTTMGYAAWVANNVTTPCNNYMNEVTYPSNVKLLGTISTNLNLWSK